MQLSRPIQTRSRFASGAEHLKLATYKHSKPAPAGSSDEYDFGEDEDADEEPAEIEIHSEDGQEDET